MSFGLSAAAESGSFLEVKLQVIKEISPDKGN